MKRISLIGAIGVVILCLFIPFISHATPALVTCRALLYGDDYIDWGVFPCPPVTTIDSPFTIDSYSGDITATVTNLTDDFATRVERDCFWHGNFSQGDALLYTQHTPGPMEIALLTPVYGIGAQIQMNAGHNVPFTATINVYDSVDNQIASFDLPGLSKTNSDGSAIFLGVLDSEAIISKIVYSVVDGNGNPEDFAINRLDIVTTYFIPLPIPNLHGTWSFSVVNNDTTWDGKKGGEKAIKATGYICQYDYIPNVPNLYLMVEDDPGDPFLGFGQGSSFSFFKNNQHGEPNLGREILIGTVGENENMFTGSGTGFDSNPEWGSIWTNVRFNARKTSDDVPIECPEVPVGCP